MDEHAKHGGISQAGLKAGMSRKTAARYLRAGKLPSELRKPRSWRTRSDPFEDSWAEIAERLKEAPELEAKILFEDMLEREPERYHAGQLRTFQRRVKQWRAQEGPEKSVFFPQEHRPGEAAQTDFSWASELEVTIAGASFAHMLCHFVLPYSNWEWATVCHSESMLALKHGIQAALTRLGRVPRYHQTDHSTAATHQLSESDKQSGSGRGFNEDYLALMNHWGMQPRTTQVGAKEQNGDVEASHGALKRRLIQHLLLRGSRDFASVADYESWLQAIVERSNARRSKRFQEEMAAMPVATLNCLVEYQESVVRVTSWSTIRVKRNTYSLPSRLMGERVQVRVYENKLEVHHGGVRQLSCDRLRGGGGAQINYRHIIGSLVRKPGAFERYRYREALFPSLIFRRGYDALCRVLPRRKADVEYLRSLKLAAETMESQVEAALEMILNQGAVPFAAEVKELVAPEMTQVPKLAPPQVDLSGYDKLLQNEPSQLQQVSA